MSKALFLNYKDYKKHVVSTLCFLFFLVYLQAQEEKEAWIEEAKRYIATGNDLLVQDGDFPQAEVEYRKAIATNPEDATAKYNLGNAYYSTENYDEAHLRYKEAVKNAQSKSEKHRAYHNQGNTYMEQKKYTEAVEAYKNALRNNPKDDETRYNLALAKKMLEQQQQNQDNKDDKDQNKDQQDQEDQKDQNEENKDGEGDKEEKDKKEGEDDKDKKGDQGEEEKDQKGEDQKDKDSDDKGDQEKDDQKPGEGDPKEQKPQQMQGQLSPQQVKSLLEAMNNQEKKVQDKINAKKVQGAKVKTDKDW